MYKIKSIINKVENLGYKNSFYDSEEELIKDVEYYEKQNKIYKDLVIYVSHGLTISIKNDEIFVSVNQFPEHYGDKEKISEFYSDVKELLNLDSNHYIISKN